MAAFLTFSVEEVPPVGKPDKSILATTSCPLALTVSPLPFTYVIVTVLSAATVYVPGLICVSVSLAIFLTSPMLAALESVSPPDLRLVMLLPPTSTLPPVMLTAGVLPVPPGLLLRVIEELPLEIELISFNALAKPTLIVVLPSEPCAIFVLILAVLYSSAYALPAVKAPVPLTVTLEPSLLVFSLPSLASNLKPLSTNASDVVLRSFTFTAAFGVLVAAVSNLVKNVLPVDVPVLSMAEPTLLITMLPPVVLPLPSMKDVITSPLSTLLPAARF